MSGIEQWKKSLTEKGYRSLKNKETEEKFSRQYTNKQLDGIYVCLKCESVLFDSGDKINSETGWYSFSSSEEDAVNLETDKSHIRRTDILKSPSTTPPRYIRTGMKRTEVHCSQCGYHIGYLFDDDSESTGKRYCINPVTLKFDASWYIF